MSTPRLTALIPVGDGAALLKRRPDVRQAERRLAAASARIGVATADLYPRVSLTGLYGGVGSHLSDLTAERGLTWGIGPSVDYMTLNVSTTWMLAPPWRTGHPLAILTALSMSSALMIE